MSEINDARLRWRLKYPERFKACQAQNKRRFRIKNPLKALVRALKYRSRRRGLEYELEAFKDLLIPEVCPVFGTPLTEPSVDRIDNSKGYVKGNIRIISNRANRLKSDMTYEECIMLLKDFECRI